MLTRAYNHRTCNLLDSREEVPFRGHLYYSRMGTQLFYVLEMQRRFECGTCSKNYKYKRDLTRHLRYECLAERQFACSLCQYRGKRKAHLIQHSMLMHNNQLE
ncbi:longitudinals lacking protein, isoforms A/B/D/L-like isoform X3 [Homalodisca vitripennis]|uniref:longitudinals lacking protein, isoforms A/B/D/L-like isoform X3 n=1 Tax=Homalodisca vitripennis TaxID=197043 RepID=UPI001EEC8145|nr:longitudinals lacking protein, isoforms A/B/D/L-like isoform X3 [Homalodisca vitripennis]